MLMKEAIQEYIVARRVYGCSARTLDALKRRLTRLARFVAKKRGERVTDARPQDLDAYAEYLAQNGARFGTRCAYMSTARVFFRWLHERGCIITNPALDIAAPNEDDRPLPEPPMSEAEISSILDGMPRRNAVDLRNRLHLDLLYSCGLRLTESLTLKIRDIDIAQRSVRIHGKGDKVRVLPLMKGTLNALKDYLALRRSLLKGPDFGTLLLGKTTGKPLGEVMIYPLLRGITKRLRLKRRPHPHLFRHSIAVHLLQRGADIRHVQEFLGHASIDTTKIYLRMVPGRLKEDYDKAMPEIAVRA